MWETLLATIVFVGIALLLLAIRMLIKRGGQFPNIHIGKNKAMSDKGITCATGTDARDRKENKLEYKKRK